MVMDGKNCLVKECRHLQRILNLKLEWYNVYVFGTYDEVEKVSAALCRKIILKEMAKKKIDKKFYVY